MNTPKALNVQRPKWAFSLSNAGAYYMQFRARVDQLDEVNWPAVAATDFRAAEVKEGKQAEFLVHHEFPWRLVRRIGVSTRGVAQQVADATRISTTGRWSRYAEIGTFRREMP